jgi:hypothetical protein
MASVAGNENVTQVANLLLFQVNNLGYIYRGDKMGENRCQATTKAGTSCKLPAQADSAYCHVHIKEAAAAKNEILSELIAELNDLAGELQQKVNYAPPAYTRQGLLQLIRDNLHKFSPEERLGLVKQLQEGLQGSSPQDFLDPDTWKGMWFLLNYTAQSEAEELRQKGLSALPGADRIAKLPGMATLNELRGMLEGSSPQDFLDVDTWKGMWFILNYSLQAQAEELKQRVLGDEDET